MDEPMGNQQEVNEVELAWLAGMMNGDGCFSLTFRTRKGKIKSEVRLTLTQCDPCVIEHADALFNRLGVTPSIVEYPATGAGMRTKWNLSVSRMAHISKIIAAIDPYMIGEKSAQARLMKRYIDRRSVYADPSKRRWQGGEIENDFESMKIAEEFYKVRRLTTPPELVQILRDYPKGVGSSDPKRTAP